MYLKKTPSILKWLYPSLHWAMPTKDKVIYLTFDDGPHETITPFVLEQLNEFNAKASFFCIGKNVEANPLIYKSIIDAGHVVGNHTQNHLNGWKHNDEDYIANVDLAAKHISSNLFRPPYGRIKRTQIKALEQRHYSIVMWDVLSGDFDVHISGEQCLQNTLKHTVAGSIIVFHDSEKALPRLSYALPILLEHFTKQGFQFKALPQKKL